MFSTPSPFGPGPIPRGPNGAKRGTYSYASSIVSQDAGQSTNLTDSGSVVGSSGPNIAYSQSDRLRRRASFGSTSVAGQSDLGSVSAYDYKSQDDATDLDDMKSQYTGTQSGLTVF